jgi:hypothetical protein
MAGCFTLTGAQTLVLSCFKAGTSLDTTLEGAGFISDSQRAVLQQTVFDKVHAAGCRILLSDIPNAGSTTLQNIMDAIFDNSSPETAGGATG